MHVFLNIILVLVLEKFYSGIYSKLAVLCVRKLETRIEFL
jgi:hypothetical protein